MIRLWCLLFITIQISFSGISLIPNASSGTQDQTNLTLKELLVRTKQAAGGNEWDRVRAIRIRWNAREGGLNGVIDEADDLVGVRYRDNSDFGVRSGSYGFNRKLVWAQDSSGLSHVEESSEAREGTINEAYRRSLVYWYPERWPAEVDYKGEKQDSGLSFHVLGITPEGGRPFELWFDETTYLLARIVENTGTGMLKVFLSEYREIEKLKVPFLVRVQLSNGAENAYRVEEFKVDPPLTETYFNVPPPPPPDFVLSGNASSVTVPFRLINNHIYISARVNGEGPYSFVVDTGWGTSSITPEVARSLGLQVRGSQKTMGAGEAVAEMGFTKVKKMQLGGLQLLNQSVVVTSSFDGKTRDAVNNFGGLFGYALFKRFVIRLDFGAGLMTLTLPAQFTHRGLGASVPFKLSKNIPLVRGEIDGVSGDFIVDSGFPGSVTFYGSFITKNNLVTRFHPRFETVTGWGVGGPVRAGVFRAQRFKLGEVSLNDLVVTTERVAIKGSHADPNLAGAIGGELLKRFNVTFDYSRQVMFLEKNRSYGRREIFDRSGMYLNKQSDWFEVIDVVAGGPADQAGIKTGDRIVSIDGKQASRLSAPEVKLKFKEPGRTRVTLIVKRNGSTRKVQLLLRDLV
jgi:predicted aspartyl protease